MIDIREFQTFVILGHNHWSKNDDIDLAIEGWLEETRYQASEAVLVAVNCDPKKVYIDGLGGVSYPQGSDIISRTIHFDSNLLREFNELDAQLYELRYDIIESVDYNKPA